MAMKATTTIHDKFLFSVLRSKLRFFESTPTGRILNRFTKDCGATEGYYLMNLSNKSISI